MTADRDSWITTGGDRVTVYRVSKSCLREGCAVDHREYRVAHTRPRRASPRPRQPATRAGACRSTRHVRRRAVRMTAARPMPLPFSPGEETPCQTVDPDALALFDFEEPA